MATEARQDERLDAEVRDAIEAASAALTAHISTLHLGERDILVVKCAEDITREQANHLFEQLQVTVRQATGDSRFPILICTNLVTLDCINDQVIREMGWVKPDELHELIQAGIEATDNTERTARLRAALVPFGVR